MSKSLLELQDTLPTYIQLLRYGPPRRHFSGGSQKAAAVRTPADLPPYLVLGNLDENTFRLSSSGWSARWRGSEEETYFEANFIADQKRYEFHQIWRGMDGGFGHCSSEASPEEAVVKCPFVRLSPTWESALKTELELKYHLSFVERPEDMVTPFYSPDGFFFTIAFPAAVCEIRQIQQLLKDIVARSPLGYPVLMASRRVVQVVNYPEGKAPAWTREPMTVFNQSLLETGLMPWSLPVRETANDGSAAWTLRREVYFIFISLPFAGLTDLLSRISDESGHLRTASAQPLRFEWWPILMHSGFEVQAESIALFDRARTTRSFLSFALPDHKYFVPSFEEITSSLANSEALLKQAEEISSEVLTTVTQLIESASGAGGSRT